MGSVRTVLVIGIGAGDPEHLTLQAVAALGRTDVVVVVDKGAAKGDLVELRRTLVDRYARPGCRWVDVPDPARDRTAGDYRGAVEDWRRRRADAYEAALRDGVGDDEVASFLVWGDPSLYDSTLAALDDVAARGTVAFDVEVIPGISSVSALAARHRTTLNRVGRPVLVTTGRRLAADVAASDADDVVVMLDPHSAFADVADDDDELFWGAYVGMEQERLVAGRVGDVADEVRRQRAEAEAEHGWVMDTYLLRRRLDR